MTSSSESAYCLVIQPGHIKSAKNNVILVYHYNLLTRDLPGFNTAVIPHPPDFSKPRLGVHSWPAIQYCERNLKFHPFNLPASCADPALCSCSAHTQEEEKKKKKTLTCTVGCVCVPVLTQIHTSERISTSTAKPYSSLAQAKTRLGSQIYLYSTAFW